MDSEVATKLNETENLKSAENFKENVPPATIDKSSDKADNAEKPENYKENDAVPVKSSEVTVKEVEVEVIVKDECETPQAETKTTTTITVTKKDNDEESPNTERETTTTVVVTENDNDKKSASEETTTTTVKVVAEKKADDVDSKEAPENENKKEGVEKVIELDSETADNQSVVIPEVSKADVKQKSIASEKEAEESESESESESEDEDEQPETEVKTKKTDEVADVKDQSNNSAQPETIANVVNADVALDEKVSITKKDINNQIENIISDIDMNIKAQEKITQLKEQELQLIHKQKELANQIHQQQILAKKLIAQNQLKEQELQAQSQHSQQLEFQPRGLSPGQSQGQYGDEAPKEYQEYTKMYSPQEDSYDIKESSNVSRTVDLRKIFTPATDAPQILPKNRKLYASSAFYSPTLHPTVEDQVQLARRISHSLSDISNHTSKGQSMYVNRKKRSVKWVHEGCGQGEDDINDTHTIYKENTESSLRPELTMLDKMPLKLIMNPRGQMRDYNSLRESINVDSGLLSPDNCAELITALQLHKGRGAELFAKRRKKAENWVVDETNAGTHSPSGIPDYQQYQQAKPATSPNILPAYSDAGKHRVQLNIHQDQLIEKYSKPGVQVIKSPWEAALQTGSASSAFLEDSKYRSQTPIASFASPVPFYRDANDFPVSGSGSGLGSVPEVVSRPPASSPYERDTYKTPYDTRVQNQPMQPCNPQRELAYKPSVAQGWGGRNVELPRGLYIPKEISLASYAPPPIQTKDQQPLSSSFHGTTQVDYSKGYPSSRFAAVPSNEIAGEVPSGFPVSNFTSGFNSSVPPKQQLYGAQSYQKVPASSTQSAPPVNFSPSPLSFDKLSKFQGTEQRNAVGLSNGQRYLNVNKQSTYGGVRNASPSPFGSAGIEDRSSTFSPNQGPARNTYISAPFQMTQICSGSGQSFNNCARGWSTGPNAQRNVSYPKVAVAADRLPYSDF